MTYITNLNNANPISVPTPTAVAAEMLSRLSGACADSLLPDMEAGHSFECAGISFTPAPVPTMLPQNR
jgi:hypothetical protein